MEQATSKQVRRLLPWLLAAACAWPSIPTCSAEETRGIASSAPQQGDLVFQADFEHADALQGWTGSPKLEGGYRSPQALSLE